MAAKKVTIGEWIDRLHAKRKEISELEPLKKRLQSEAAAIEKQAIEAMDKEKTTQGAGRVASAHVNEVASPHVTDWDELYKYIHENRYYHLLHRRASSTGCMELIDAGESIPGVEKFVQRKINLRSI